MEKPRNRRARRGPPFVTAAAILAGFGLVTMSGDALAQEVPADDGQREATASKDPGASHPSAGKRAASAGAAVIPGVVAHGAGHFVLGESSTARSLLFAELAGLGLIAAGGIPIVFSGASRYVVGPGAAAVVLGVGLFSASFAADMYGTLSTDADAAGRRARPPPWIETELGYRSVSDPLFTYEHFVFERVSMTSGRLRLTPSAWFSTAGDNARYRVESAFRLLGAVPSARSIAVSNDRLDVLLGLVHHRYAPVGFVRSSLELAVDTRYDLAHIGPTLRGAFVEAAVGYSLGRISYRVAGSDLPADTDSLLLARIGFGAVLRGESKPGSELVVYYDHRHDDFAAGWVMPGLGSGVAGHFGTEARWFFTRSLGLSVLAERGSAFVAGLSVLFRQSGAGFGGEKRGGE